MLAKLMLDSELEDLTKFRLKADVIVTHAVPNVLAAKQATPVIPMVFALAADLVGSGFKVEKLFFLSAISSCKSVSISSLQVHDAGETPRERRHGDPMRRTAIITSLSADVMRRIRHFGDFVTVPLAIVIFVDLAGMYCLYLVLLGIAVWTLLEYLVHRIVFHRHSVGRRLHQLHHDHPNDPDAERSSLSTPLIASPIGILLIVTAGVEDGSAIFAGLLLGYLAFIVVHYAVHRWPIEPHSCLYSAKIRHLTHHRFENCNYGVTTIFWDIVFRTNAGIIGERVRSGTG